MRAAIQKENPLIRPVNYPAIDGIRFYAALAVFIQHVMGAAALEYFRVPNDQLSYDSSNYFLRALNYLNDGNHGVDIFFIISGFLMARIIFSSERTFSYIRFIGNRFKRIYPAFCVALILVTMVDCLVFGWTWSPIDFAKNLLFLDAIPGSGVIHYNHVTWSLGFEFAFYLVIPALLLITKFIDKRIAALLVLACAVWFIPDPYVRMKPLFVGSLIGSMNDKELTRIARMVPLWLAVGLYISCGLGKASLWFSTYLSYYYCLLPCAALLLIKIVWDDQNCLNRLFTATPQRMLGTLSFSIYLFHSAIASVVLYHMTPQPASVAGLIWYMILSVVITLAFSYASFMFIERRYFFPKRPFQQVNTIA